MPRRDPDMTMRLKVSPGHLYTLLNEEWRVQRPAACTRCRMPLPVAIRRADASLANWRIGAAPWCPQHCGAVIAEIAARLEPMYDLAE